MTWGDGLHFGRVVYVPGTLRVGGLGYVPGTLRVGGRDAMVRPKANGPIMRKKTPTEPAEPEVL